MPELASTLGKRRVTVTDPRSLGQKTLETDQNGSIPYADLPQYTRHRREGLTFRSNAGGL
jgi:hypothetical protein